ncbi:MAG: hypothetical protein AAF557_02835 [Pseudomonadota bacterium]
MTEDGDFFSLGWQRFAVDDNVLDWVRRATPVAEATLRDPEQRRKWLRCGGTWFAGVNVLPNDADAAIPSDGVPPLTGAVIDFVRDQLGLDGFAWDPGQISICFPGYPQPWEGETEAAFGFRKNRDAAHVDGLLRVGPDRRRALGEVHGFILGLPMTDAGPNAAPVTVYEGSHEIMRAAFQDRFAGISPKDWSAEDVTDIYVAARRRCFETCARVTVHAGVGQSYLIHRLALHGVAPWSGGEGMRMIAYFRPDPFPGAEPGWWLDRP